MKIINIMNKELGINIENNKKIIYSIFLQNLYIIYIIKNISIFLIFKGKNRIKFIIKKY